MIAGSAKRSKTSQNGSSLGDKGHGAGRGNNGVLRGCNPLANCIQKLVQGDWSRDNGNELGG